LAMLVPSEDSNMDSERLASAHRTEGIRSTLPTTASTRPAVVGFNMNPLCLADAQNGTVRFVLP
jgi:N-acetylglucosamine-6-phosphate deacetylase